MHSYITLQDGDGRKLKGPKTQIKWPNICAVDKITAFKSTNHNMGTLKFHLQVFGGKKHAILPIAKSFRTAVCSDSLVARPGGQVTGKDSLNMAAMSCSILA